LEWFKRNLANIVTLIRVAILPVFVVLMVLSDPASSHNTAYQVAAWLVFGFGAVTDWFDGQIARRTRTVSKFGTVVDPLADRLFIGGALITLYCLHMLPLLFLVLVLGRDILMAAGYPFIRKIDASKVAVHWTGKIATGTLFGAIGCLILSTPSPGASWVGFAGFSFSDFGTWQTWGLWLFVIGIFWSLLSAGIYASRVAALLKEAGDEQAGEGNPQTVAG
jgi:cardiolipin synthase